MSTALTLANLDGPQIVSLFRMRVATKSPFFTVLSYNCKFIGFTNSKEIAYTNGRAVYFNVAYFAALSNPQRTAIFIHELLHIAYSHIPRCRHRDPFTWNIACFEKDAPVLTENGYQPIASIAPGTRVLTREGTYEPVAALLSKEYTGQLITIKPHGCLEIKATADHKFLTRSRKSKRYPIKLEEPQWKEASELTTDDYILVPKSQVQSTPVVPLSAFLSGERREILKGDIPLDTEAAWALGRYLADGSAVSDNAISWSIGASKPQDADRLSKWLYSLGHTGTIVPEDNTLKVQFNSVAFRKLTEHYFERGARNKGVPSFMFGQSPEVIASFIKGWQDGDGCPTPKTRGNCGWTCSLDLALGIQRLAISVGISIDVRYATRNRALPGATKQTIQTGYQIQTHANLPTTRVLNGKVIASTKKRAKTLKDGLWVPINKVNAVDFKDTVYTLNVENSHTYTVWNMTVKNCDIYVNQIITELEYCTLPDNAVLEPDLWRETTEEIYELLLQNPDSIDKYQGNRDQIIDLRPTAGDGEGDGDEDKDGDSPGTNGKPLTPEEAAGLIANWDRLLEVAQQEQLNKTDKYGSMPSKLARTLTNLNQPQIDWRQALLNYLTTSPNDYAGFDRRFIAAGCYDDCLDGQTVRVDVCIDTSGSIGEKELGVFISELAGILQSYPEVNCDLYWADTVAYGPYSIEDLASVPKPEGGGGTCFKDFFIKSAAMTDKEPAGIAIYLTDGYGSFPEEEPPIDTLWVVSHDGLNLNKFPFGLAVKLTS